LARVWASLARLCRSSPVAAELLPTLHAETSSDRPAVALRRLGIALAACSVESHPLIYLTVNSVLPWSALASLWLERERAALAESLPKAVREMHEFEAWTSLALYAAEHGGAWPEFVAEARLEVDGLAHPLLPAATAVGNSFRLARTKAGGEATALLTGSNMSGKSTFLRALGCNQLFACAGAPVRAERYTCGPLAVETCVQIADSLANGVSYFYAEVLRLRDILAAAREKNRMALVLVDEIFRGTNNRERLAGSRAVIRALASSGALAAVSTHDLELTTLASEGVGNWHFRDDVKDGRLGFDYRVRPGPCPTTNALLIMRQEGLPVPEPQAPEPGSD
jgi:DNA mismatch repair ATPase MutS